LTKAELIRAIERTARREAVEPKRAAPARLARRSPAAGGGLQDAAGSRAARRPRGLRDPQTGDRAGSPRAGAGARRRR
jgi:hypothetical protein